jgi:hypothetical protein
MSVELNHTIIPAKDKWVSAKFLADILNLEAGREWGHFVPVKTANGVTLDFDTREEFRPGHYAFLVVRPHPRSGRPVLRRSAAHQARRDQSSARRSRRLFRGPQRSRDGNNHPPLRRPTRADLIARAPATARCVGAAPRSGVAGMSMWSMSSDARASRITLIMVDTPGLARALDAEGLTVAGWSASVTSAGGSHRRVAARSQSRSAAGRVPRRRLCVRTARARYPGREHT